MAIFTAAAAVRLRAPRLEHEEAAALDGELQVLDVAIVLLEPLGDALELAVDGGHRLAHLGDLLGRADAGHDVLALGVREVLAEEDLLARVGVAREGHAGARVVAHVAEDHRHDVDRGAQVVGDLLVLPVVAGALAEPRGEDRLDGQVELLVGVLGELAAGVLAHDGAVGGRDVAQVAGVEIGVEAHPARLLGGVEGMIEALAVDAHHDAPEHLDEASVGVPAEALVVGQRDEAVQGGLVEAEVEDRVHHARHAELGTRADAHQERVGRVAEALAGLVLDRPDRFEDVLPEAGRKLLTGREVVVAGLGRDGEARWHGQARIGHLGQAGALAAEQVAHRRVAFRATTAPGVDVALGGLVGTLGRGGRGGHAVGSLVGQADRVGRRAGPVARSRVRIGRL